MAQGTTTGELYRQYTAVLEHEKRIRGRDRILSATVGGVFTALFMTPFDVVKIRLQVQRKPLSPGDKFVISDGILDHLCTCSNGNHVERNSDCEINIRRITWYKRPGHFNGTFDAFKKIVKYEGVGSLWSGLYPTIFMSLPTVAVYYPTYDLLKDTMGYANNPHSVAIPLVASGSARAVASILFCPAEVIRTKMQSEKMPAMKVFRCVSSQVSAHGFSSLFLGLTPSLLRDVPFSMIYWSMLEQIRRRLAKKFNKSECSVLINIISGSIGGGVAAIVTLPFDVVKTQAQIELGSKSFANGKQTVPVHKTLHSIWMKDGARGLFAGFTPRLLRIMPACAIMLSTYELLKRFLSS